MPFFGYVWIDFKVGNAFTRVLSVSVIWNLVFVCHAKKFSTPPQGLNVRSSKRIHSTFCFFQGGNLCEFVVKNCVNLLSSVVKQSHSLSQWFQRILTIWQNFAGISNWWFWFVCLFIFKKLGDTFCAICIINWGLFLGLAKSFLIKVGLNVNQQRFLEKCIILMRIPAARLGHVHFQKMFHYQDMIQKE